VILGCTHYPLIRPVFERVFGRGHPRLLREETAREVGRDLAASYGNDPAVRPKQFLTTGDRALPFVGERLLQHPLPRRTARLGRRSNGGA